MVWVWILLGLFVINFLYNFWKVVTAPIAEDFNGSSYYKPSKTSRRIGRRSLLFGVHQFVWHPGTVLLAWWHLFGRPGWKEVVCIVIHDWGYWSAPNMDGPEGEKHPELGARLAGKWFGQEYHELCLYHSRHYARSMGAEPSKLCWADKLSIQYDPWWFYLLRAWASGELKEYRVAASMAGFVPLSVSHREWFNWLKIQFSTIGREMRKDVVPYSPERKKVV